MPLATSTPRTLAEVIAPLEPARFLRSSWGKRFFHLPGPPGKFASLMPWDALNGILTDQALPHAQMLLWRNRKLLPLPVFEQRVQQLRTPELLDELSRGATLVLNTAQTCFRPLRDLTEDLEADLRAQTYANLYASWRAEPGFGVHRDLQHTLILQVSGRKRWSVYPPSAEAPARATRPLWAGTLEDGELLHIPKGFWHHVVSVNEPSLHLTITVVPVEAGDVLQWLATQAAAEVARTPRRMDVPVLGTEIEKRRWVVAMRKQLERVCTGDVIARFLAEREGGAAGRPRLELPALGPSRIGLDTPVRLARSRLHIAREGADRIALRCGDATWSMSKRALPVLKALADHQPHTLRELLARHDLEALGRPMQALVRDLAKHQVVVVVAPR